MVISLLPAIYIGLLFGVKIPGCGDEWLTPHCNIEAYVDHMVFGPEHMIMPVDGEGIVGALGSTYNMFMGCFYLPILDKYKGDPMALVKHWFLPGIYMILLSIPIAFWVPYNRKVWTPSFALLSSGIFGFLLILFYLIFDYDRNETSEKIKNMFIWLGANILFIYSGMVVVINLLVFNLAWTSADGTPTNMWVWLYSTFLTSWLPYEYMASFLFAFLHLIMWIYIGKAMYERKIFIHV